MKTTYDPTLKATVTLDNTGAIRGVNHLDEYREIEHLRGRNASAQYVRDMAGRFNIASEALHNIQQMVSYSDPQKQGVEYRFSEEKSLFDTTTYAYCQTYLNIPVWGSGITTTIKQAPTRVIAATDTSRQDIDAKMVPAKVIERFRNLFATGEKGAPSPVGSRRGKAEKADAAAAELLADLLGKPSKDLKAQHIVPELIRGRFYVYRYDATKRTAYHQQEEGPYLAGNPPTLPLPPVPDTIRDGHWYIVAELIYRRPHEGRRMNWRALVELESGAILYQRALTSEVNGLVFVYDPITSSGDTGNTPNQNNATLNPHRESVVLPNLNAPVGGNQSLQGSWATLSEIETPGATAPTRPAGSDFNIWDVRTNEFAAVNAYYHTDRFFQLIADLGFPLTGAGSYFDGTAFPVEVDHRGLGNAINAHCIGDGDGIDHTCYALADATDTANPIGIATDWRVVLHELGGHGILYDHVGTANFGFAHSAGDSFTMILNDYASEWHNGASLDRYLFLPFVPSIVRRSDRTVAAGWGWGGTHDVGSYSSEQILSTTMFRAYQAIGGDSASFARREFAARCMIYLILRAVGTLTPSSNPSSANQFLAALLNADAGNWTSEGIFGGAYGKVLSWAFEKQNLNSGAPPSVDVYIDDGRAGEYQYLAVHWATTTIWNRRSADGLTGHQEPALLDAGGLPATNYAYVKIKNRGTSIANNVIVKAYHCKPSAGVLWPNDLQPMTTAQLPVGTVQPNNAQEVIVGPFEWTPVMNAWGHDCMLMIVSATGDPSNVDNFTAGEVVEDWRLVPNDNNVGQRNVTVVPGGGGLRGLLAGLNGRGFWIGNPGRSSATMAVSVFLPPLLARRGWRLRVQNLSQDGERFKAREQRLVSFALKAGSPFTAAEVEAAKERDIIVTATADGAIIGGMTYRLDPEIVMPFNDLSPEQRKGKCCDKAKDLLECLDLPGDKVKCARVRRITIDVKMKGDDD